VGLFKKKKKTFYKNGTKKGENVKGNSFEWWKMKLLWKGEKHTLYLIYKRIIFFSFSFSFYI
jgi:hypothetical protein